MCLDACCSDFGHVRVIRTVTGDSELYSLWIRYTDDSKTVSWDDLEIHTGSCGGDQMAIRFQNRVISCECSCLFSYLPLSVGIYLLLVSFHVIV